VEIQIDPLLKIWYESYVPVFLEKFVLPVLAASIIAIIVLNPFNLDRQQRISLLIGVLAIAYFVGYSLYKGSAAKTTITPPSPPTINQSSTDSACSNVVTGGSATIDCSPNKEPNANKPAPKSP
jgi:hypothetical protein